MSSMACIESDDTREPGDEAERPSHVETIPLAPACGHPCPVERQRRDLCASCYRKLDEADALPPRRTEHRDRVHPLRRWLATLSTAQLIQLKAWIEELTR